MSAIFDVVHPAALRYLPQRARNVRFALVPVTTSVRLIEVDRREMPVVGRIDKFRVHAHEGQLWTRLHGFDTAADLFRATGDAASTDPEIARKAFDHVHGNAAYRMLIVRSPLRPFFDSGLSARHNAPVGVPHTVVRDNSERAAADLHAYLDGHVRIVDDAPFVRVRGPLCRIDEVLKGRIMCASADAWALSSAGTVTTPRSALAAQSFWERYFFSRGLSLNEMTAGGESPDAFQLSLVPENRDDVLHFVNRSPSQIMSAQRDMVSAESIDLMSPWAEIGLLGGVRIEEADTVLDAVVEACNAAMDHHEAAGRPRPESLRYLLEFAQGYVRPRLETAPAPEDDEALRGFGVS